MHLRQIRIPLRWLFLFFVVVGIGIRVLATLRGWPSGDGGRYAALGDSLSRGQGFLLPWGSPFQGIDFASVPLQPFHQTSYAPIPSEHDAPLWPMVLALAYEIGGFSLATSEAASFLVSLLLLLVTFLATRDLLGRDKAWFVTAFAALDFLLVATAANLLSEDLIAVCYVATIWAILRSLKDDRFIILAGIFAGAGYLTRASIGYFFLLAGAVGFLWRFYYLRWSVFRNRHYLAAIGLFLLFVGSWSLRNLLVFGWPNWETSPYLTYSVVYSLQNPLLFAAAFAEKTLLFLLFYALVGAFLLPQILAALRRYREEDVSAHLLAILLPGLLGVIFAAALGLYEHNPWLDDGNLRYVDVAFVPLLWLALRGATLPSSWNLELRIVEALRPGSLLRMLQKNAFRLPLILGAAAVTAFFSVAIGIVLLIGTIVFPRAQPMRMSILVAFLLAFMLSNVNSLTGYTHPPELAAGKFLARVARQGDVVAIPETGDVDEYIMYPDVGHLNLRFVPWNGSVVNFLMSDKPGNYSGYVLLATFHTETVPSVVTAVFGIAQSRMRAMLGLRPAAAPSPSYLYLYQGTGP